VYLNFIFQLYCYFSLYSLTELTLPCIRCRCKSRCVWKFTAASRCSPYDSTAFLLTLHVTVCVVLCGMI